MVLRQLLGAELELGTCGCFDLPRRRRFECLPRGWGCRFLVKAILASVEGDMVDEARCTLCHCLLVVELLTELQDTRMRGAEGTAFVHELLSHLLHADLVFLLEGTDGLVRGAALALKMLLGGRLPLLAPHALQLLLKRLAPVPLLPQRLLRYRYLPLEVRDCCLALDANLPLLCLGSLGDGVGSLMELILHTPHLFLVLLDEGSLLFLSSCSHSITFCLGSALCNVGSLEGSPGTCKVCLNLPPCSCLLFEGKHEFFLSSSSIASRGAVALCALFCCLQERPELLHLLVHLA
mmetsp:Transcript_22406/g.53554  ORF Transcript_22406/g.53554 Transcript_22406/m.53554 type:complete len:293 (+) Transcript_22406:459-1337(+)